MRIVRWAAATALLFLVAHVAMADGVGDPRFIPIGGSGSTVLTSPTDPNFVINYSGTQTYPPIEPCGFYGDYNGGTSCAEYDFVNDSGVAWTGIQFVITSAGGAITDDLSPTTGFSVDNSLDPYFTNATAIVNGAGQVVLSFFGTDSTHPGILPATSCYYNADENPVCDGPYLGDSDTPLYDFGILVDVTGQTGANDSFSAQGSAAVPEPGSIFLLLAGAAMLGFYLNKRA